MAGPLLWAMVTRCPFSVILLNPMPYQGYDPSHQANYKGHPKCGQAIDRMLKASHASIAVTIDIKLPYAYSHCRRDNDD
jgi:hypothetical protein